MKPTPEYRELRPIPDHPGYFTYRELVIKDPGVARLDVIALIEMARNGSKPAERVVEDNPEAKLPEG